MVVTPCLGNMLQKPPRFFYLQMKNAGNIMNLLQIDGNKLARRNKHVCLAMNCNQAYNKYDN